MLKFAVGLVACALVGAAVATPSPGASSLTKRQFIARGDAICRSATVQISKLPQRTTMPVVAAKGARWLAINRRALKALRALTPPRRDRARVRAMFVLADRSINKGIAGFVAAARSGNLAAFIAAGRRAQAMINTGHRAARAYGFKACARW